MFRLLIPCAQERTGLRKNVEPYNVSTFDEIGWGVSMNKNYEKLMRCYESLREKVKFEPKVAIVLGSGLGDFADNIQIEEELPYGDIEGFPVSTVPAVRWASGAQCSPERTAIPRFASCHAASHPASPAPITVTFIFSLSHPAGQIVHCNITKPASRRRIRFPMLIPAAP